MKKFGLDIDGTVTHPGTFIPYLNKHFKKNITLDDITEYDLTQLLGVSSETFWDWMKEHEQIIYMNADLASFSKDVIRQWATNDQHELVYISARGDHLLEVTQQWFEKNSIPYGHIELIGQHDKIDAIKEHQVDIFFEDKHDNACDIAEECQIPVILLDTPYNRKPTPENVIRVYDWKEANDWVNKWIQK
ncbi:hypothetical protein [Desertibacillus haloalkaliphilus]|uniref:hypothetical protein n=1 Tax=Desertibacillus haloalkaliphilus TaxID=1328930 RepID=UPI001C277580|nr:hypothetical protein [Desertibacillus haloalkaliphilus]MBU8905702.1 hypothetical protein [Desertibacillus haloalkaliphilus]